MIRLSLDETITRLRAAAELGGFATVAETELVTKSCLDHLETARAQLEARKRKHYERYGGWCDEPEAGCPGAGEPDTPRWWAEYRRHKDALKRIAWETAGYDPGTNEFRVNRRACEALASEGGADAT